MKTRARKRAGAARVRLKAKLFRGLADKSRLALLEALRDGPQNVSELVARTGLSQPNASTHLACLWCCGLVDREPRGRFTYYRIRSQELLPLLADSDAVLDEAAERIEQCERYAEERADDGG